MIDRRTVKRGWPVTALALGALLLASCSNGGSSSNPGGEQPPTVNAPAFLTGPALTPNANARVPLAATISFTTDVPATASLTIDDGDRVWSVAPAPGSSSAHELTLLDVHPGKLHSITVAIVDSAGQVTISDPIEWTTPALPALFPPAEVTVPAAPGVQGGVTMVGMRWAPEQPDQEFDSYLVMYDDEGQVVWWYGAPRRVSDSRRLSNGNLLYLMGNNGGVEIDMLGETVQWWWANNVTDPPTFALDLGWPEPTLVALDSIHHEMYELPAGGDADFLLLSSEVREIADYPNDVVDPTQTDPTANVVADVIAEVTRDGQVVRQWSLFDYLDVYRVSYGSTGSFWDSTYGIETRDWTHANAVIPDFENDSLIVSLRHQDAVISMPRGPGKLNWILGSHDRWVTPWSLALLDPILSDDFQAPDLGVPFGTPASSFEWQFHQHAPMITQSGDLLLFDNGNGRTVPPTPELAAEERYSRAVTFRIDADAQTVEGVWEYGSQEDPWYSLFICDADELTNGNVLVCDGGEAMPGPVGQVGWTRLVEVSTTTPAEVLWELTVRDDDQTAPLSWNAYRAERLSGVYE